MSHHYWIISNPMPYSIVYMSIPYSIPIPFSGFTGEKPFSNEKPSRSFPALCDSLNEWMLHSVNYLSKFETSTSPLTKGTNGAGSSFFKRRSQSKLKNHGCCLISGINAILLYGSFSNSFSSKSLKCLLQFLL